MTAIDLSVVQELLDLCDDDDLELFIELIDVFLRDAPTRIDSVVRGAESGDLEQVVFASHALKGSSGNLGAVALQDAADLLQVAGRSGDLAAVRAQVAALRAAFEAAASELRALASELGSD